MGMDVYGKNPKQNVDRSKFSTLHKYESMEFRERWKLLDKDEKLRQTYWLEKDDYEQQNPGFYFRNNCWWWRPLWDYCANIAPDLISDELWDSGHHNDGAGLEANDAAKLGVILMTSVEDGTCERYHKAHIDKLEALPKETCQSCNGNNHGFSKKKDCKRCEGSGEVDNFSKNYPFHPDNVERFANFCIQSGGFEIN
tara:strand:- start:1365 stop:1955 length:591 start_codon:yes stop_codon:yes gene_type:complete